MDLLRLIEEGTVSLLYAPPIIRAPHLEKNRTDKMFDPSLDWAEWVMKLQFSEAKDMLAECVRMFQEAFPKVPDRDLMSVVEKEVLADMASLQLQPDIMDNYRRFVAITETRNGINLESEGVRIARRLVVSPTSLTHFYAGGVRLSLEIRFSRRLFLSTVVHVTWSLLLIACSPLIINIILCFNSCISQ